MTLTNKDIALALGYTVREEEHWFTLLRPNGKERWIGENPGMASTEEDAWNLFNPRTDLAAAFEIDDWLHGKGYHTSLLRNSKDTLFCYTATKEKLFSGDGLTRSEAIVTAFEAYREGQAKP